MRKIQTLVDQIDEEIEGAKDYAECYLDLKASGNQSLAQKYRGMAEDELRHAMINHDRAVNEIQKLRSVYTPPVAMQEKWNMAHKEYVERTAWVRQMLDM